MTSLSNQLHPSTRSIAERDGRFRALVTAISDIVYVMSPDWRVMYQLDGRGFLPDTPEPSDDWMQKYILADDMAIVQAAIVDAIENKRMFQLEHRVLRADGSPGWTLSRAVPILNEEGEIIEWFGAASDITERHQIQEELRTSIDHAEQQKRLYETITSSTPDLIYVFDLSYRFTYVNRALLNMWGKTWDTAIGKGLRENGYEEWHAQMHEREIDHIRLTKQPIRGEVSFPHVELGSRIYDYILTPVLNEEGEVTAIAGTTRDITDIRKAEAKSLALNQELNAAQDQLNFALTAAGIGTWDLNIATQVVLWDDRCRELFGFPQDCETTYREVLRYIHDDDRRRIDKAVQAALEPNSNGYYDVRYRTVGATDKRLRWVHCKGRAFFDAENQPYRFAGTVQDVTDEVIARRREQQLLSLVSHNSDHMSIADMEGRMIYMNESAKQLLGVDPDEDYTLLHTKDFYEPKELVRIQHLLLPGIDPEKSWKGITRLKNKTTGEVIPCEVSYMQVTDPDTGEVIGHGATVRDLRPELKARAELQRLATMVDVSEDFSNYCDTEGRTLYLNQSGKELISLNEHEFKDVPLYDYHSEASNHLIRQTVIPTIYQEGRWSGRLELVNQKTGEIIPIHKQMYLIREDITNEPVAIAGIARDLRPEIQAREALNKVIREMAFLADAIPAVVWTSTPEGQLDYVNKRWHDLHPGQKDTPLGDAWLSNLHPDDAQRAQIAWTQAINTGEPYHIEFRIREGEEYRWYLVQALPLHDDEGRIVKWYGTNTDIQFQKELQAQKDNFLGVASHELKTPVTSIKAYAQVLERIFQNNGDAKSAELVGKMDRQINRLNSLISDLLDVTKINSGRMQFNESVFSFSELVAEMVEDIQRTAVNHIIKRELNFDGEITGDRDRLGQVITNLLTNAIKYSPDSGRIMVYTHRENNEIQLFVQDFGIGISPEKQDKVFEQFYRVSGTREHTFPGLGLGLYISAEIVHRMGGRIWVNSTEGKGSTFCVALPVTN
ncbi:PAS domain S-box protein [Mucilaginibacter sp. SG564]|uniref:PAS domain-containing sensor histidine kinase n=1 Tax=Mucilaginibacter sp. SG564 TaxID=2587022 RepID=UPI001557FA1F|nr:PAS domain S-box protein [Mucilaginibacter sp. SG564]NOW97156.1 PAS domain S-box-containing protein [Mucilaginibacter sp. SG564]